MKSYQGCVPTMPRLRRNRSAGVVAASSAGSGLCRTGPRTGRTKRLGRRCRLLVAGPPDGPASCAGRRLPMAAASRQRDESDSCRTCGPVPSSAQPEAGFGGGLGIFRSTSMAAAQMAAARQPGTRSTFAGSAHPEGLAPAARSRQQAIGPDICGCPGHADARLPIRSAWKRSRAAMISSASSACSNRSMSSAAM